ncbi:MAG: Hint domain-containing protein [Paracoccaceae bacterium]|nr:Hint domain-containing protein [Paracoccaceae bacterium]
MPGIFVDPDHGEVEYFHLLFDHHEVIFAEGAPTESFYTGPEALKAISAEAMEEILAILPELNRLSYAPDPACHIRLAICKRSWWRVTPRTINL